MRELTRRRSLAGTAGLLLSCRAQTETRSIRLKSRPATTAETVKPGVHPLHLRVQRDALLYIPASVPLDRPAPLVVYLHGATGNEQQGVRRMTPYADAFQFVLLSPASENETWDAIRDSYGPDVRFLDRVLDRTFQMCAVDPSRIAVSGFSDGASYALGLGLSNGDLFQSVMAFSPGFVPPPVHPAGKPRFFISHGTADRILPIDRCSRKIVAQLKLAGYDVMFREFDGPHTLPRDVGDAAMRWFLAGREG